jgi:hypothetical protein
MGGSFEQCASRILFVERKSLSRIPFAGYIVSAGWLMSLILALLPLFGISDYRKFAVCLPFETGDSVSLGMKLWNSN